jgi:hypothetical protein
MLKAIVVVIDLADSITWQNQSPASQGSSQVFPNDLTFVQSWILSMSPSSLNHVAQPNVSSLTLRKDIVAVLM